MATISTARMMMGGLTYVDGRGDAVQMSRMVSPENSHQPHVIVIQHKGGCADVLGKGCQSLAAAVLLVLSGLVFFYWLGKERMVERQEQKVDWAEQRIRFCQALPKRLYPDAKRVDLFDMKMPDPNVIASSAQFTFNAWVTDHLGYRDRFYAIWSEDHSIKECGSVWSSQALYPNKREAEGQGAQEELPDKAGVSAKALEWVTARANGQYELVEFQWVSLVCPDVYSTEVAFKMVTPDGKKTPQKLRFVFLRRGNLIIAIDNLLIKGRLARTDNEDHLSNAKWQLPDFQP